MSEFLIWLIQELGVPIALFTFTIFVVLRLLDRDSKQRDHSVYTVNRIAQRADKSYRLLEKNYRELYTQYGRAREAYLRQKAQMVLMEERYRQATEELKERQAHYEEELRKMREELIELKATLTEREREIGILRRRA